MSNEELHKRVESSAALQRVREALLSEASFRVGASARFDPFTIIMIISVVVQVLAYCRDRRKPEELLADMRNAQALSRFRTRRLRKRLDAIWEECCDGTYEDCRHNPLLPIVLDAAENASDAELQELITIAAEQE